jgi:CRISPR system Cascade subunit CasB
MTSTSPLSRYVDSTIRELQNSYVHGDRRGSSAALAALRRAVGAGPGTDAAVWEYTLAGLPQQYIGHSDEPSPGERAVHAAVTLYAVHQQSKTMPMHQNGPSMGRAVRRLGGARTVAAQPDASKAVKRRFDALMTAVTFSELNYHARGLIGQLRTADIPLDYGAFAEDLRQLQNVRTADAVRLRWGRDYSYLPAATGTAKTTTDTTSPEGAAQ